MYSSNQHDYKKFSASSANSAPPPFSQPPTLGVPMSSASQPYYGNFSPARHVQPGVQAPSQPYYGNVQTTHQVQPGVLATWSSGLCDCCSDVSNSCVANGVLYTLINLLTGCACLYSCIYRSKLRHQFKLQGGSCGDCLIHSFCEPCALCQEYRELKNRGFNMSIGWEGNVHTQNGVMMAPVVQGGMGR